jgi:acyl-CoA thioesterase-1
MGANDGLRGHAPPAIKSNLSTMIQAGLSNGAAIALIEMDIPANYGSAYRDAFRSIYRELSDQFDIILIPSVFDEIFGDPQLLQADGLHPNQKAQILIKKRVLSTLSKTLQGL